MVANNSHRNHTRLGNSLTIPIWECKLTAGLSPSLPEYQVCIGVMLELRKGGQNESHEDKFWPTKQILMETCSDIWLSRYKTCAWRWQAFLSMPVSADTAYIRVGNKNLPSWYCLCTRNKVYYFRLKINHMMKLANVHLFFKVAWMRTITLNLFWNMN